MQTVNSEQTVNVIQLEEITSTTTKITHNVQNER